MLYFLSGSFTLQLCNVDALYSGGCDEGGLLMKAKEAITASKAMIKWSL